MIKKISDSELESFGMSTNHEIMENDELRFRLVSTDGSSCGRSVSGAKGFWQNSHYHNKTKELYVVQKGWMAIAEYIDMQVKIKICYPYDIVISEPGIVHNVYLAPNTITYVVKFGDCVQNDKFQNDEFNELTKPLTEEDIKKFANRC